jgi:hypothetical protein
VIAGALTAGALQRGEDNVTSRSLFRTIPALGLCLAVGIPAFPKTYGNIGPSEVIGIIAGGAAVLGVTGYLIYRGAHKHASIQGCVVSDENGLTLRNEKDKKTYFLAGDSASLRPGQHVTLSGKKTKNSSGKFIFQVQRLKTDLGECQP